ncbi:hypothetical protein [Caulobacter sp.]|uniref:hypothetical protein n=1 Tax=Caulobacter sp. TaxID=78 RepID=UPI002B48A031|nr:hypothetical protein [Caulobacter sp.]HJV41478.1 hypothetical protein [Caulobacter sp.]
MTKPSEGVQRPGPPPRPSSPPAEPTAAATAEGVRRQRRHIKTLTGEDPLRGGVAD